MGSDAIRLTSFLEQRQKLQCWLPGARIHGLTCCQALWPHRGVIVQRVLGSFQGAAFLPAQQPGGSERGALTLTVPMQRLSKK